MFLLASNADTKVDGNTEGKSGFDLTIEESLISLSANDVSLKEIIEELAHRMEIDVIGNIPEEEKISIEVDKLSLKELLEELSANYGYLVDSENEEKRITKIIVLPKGKETSPSSLKTKQAAIQETKISETQDAKESEINERESKETKRPEPFKFEFDPSKYMK